MVALVKICPRSKVSTAHSTTGVKTHLFRRVGESLPSQIACNVLVDEGAADYSGLNRREVSSFLLVPARRRTS